MQCLDGVKHLLSSIVNCCESEISKEPCSLGDPEALAMVTVCMASKSFSFCGLFHFIVERFPITMICKSDAQSPISLLSSSGILFISSG